MAPALVREYRLTDLERLQLLLEDRPWTFARTMPYNPHFWSARKDWGRDEDFVWAVRALRALGFVERWPPPPAKKYSRYPTIILGDYRYWTMGWERIEPGPYVRMRDCILINRKRRWQGAYAPGRP